MKPTFPLLLCLLAGWFCFSPGYTQDRPALRFTPVISPGQRALDSAGAVKVPLVTVPREILDRSLPSAVNNSKNIYWPVIQDQYMFYTCQQYAGAVYTLGYEINRVRNRDGRQQENYYPAHYTWNFLNQGDRYVGVDFLHTFDVVRQQGHMAGSDYGFDTATGVLGWISGYDKYYRAMNNRIRQVKAIQTNSTDGILALRNFLYDHLDGSAHGGIACFTTSSYTLNFLSKLPAGTPEAGRSLINGWQSDPNHGLTVVGYNDSIRADVNGDGKYTNNLDITGDGIVDARDWEIGGFKIANSYGFWWADTGFAYSLYRNFALDHSQGGIWNNRVYFVEADTSYTPLLTLKTTLEYNARDHIRIRAGVSTDTLDELPEHVIDFPIFGFQGGEYPMKGYDTIAGANVLELGLDVTPLLNFVPAGQPARYFMVVEERDPYNLGTGKIRSASFIHYGSLITTIAAHDTGVAIIPDGVTQVSAVATFQKPAVHIATETLPPVSQLQPPGYPLAATGGRQPYDWSLVEEYLEIPTSTPEPQVTGPSIVVHSDTRHFTAVPLPFEFPFYGKMYDTIYVNQYGFLCFEPQNLPAPYTADETAMLRMFPVIVPSFSLNYTYQDNKGDGIRVQSEADRIIIRWIVSVSPYITSSVDDFAVILYPDGSFEVCYGTMDNQGFLHTFYSGISKGDNLNNDLRTQWDGNAMAGKSFRYIPPLLPPGAELSQDGKLVVNESDPGTIYDLPVRVSDAGRITDSRMLTVSQDLAIEQDLVCACEGGLQTGVPAVLKLVLSNRGSQTLPSLTLSISTIDPMLVLVDSACSAGDLASGQTVTIPAAFDFRLRQNAPDGYPVRVLLVARSGSSSWKKELRFPVIAPTLAMESPVVDDGYNGILDPGEVADLVTEIRNSGSLDARDLHLRLTTAVPGISILSPFELPVDSVGVNSSFECRFRLKASTEIKAGTVVPMQLTLSDSTGPLIIKDFEVRVGNRPVIVVDLASSNATAAAITAALDSLQVGYDTIGHLSFTLNRYGCIFLILGTSPQGNHTLTTDEGERLAGWLRNHGNLYLESYYTWYYQNNTALHPMLKYASKKVPAYFYADIMGRDSTFTDSMAYVYSLPLNFSVFTVEPVAPAYATFLNTDSPPRSLEVVYHGDDYKTIGTFTAFSGLVGVQSPASQKELMRRYLEFFDLNLAGPFPLFHAATTEVCRNQSLTFTDDSYSGIVSRSWEFEGGTPAVSTEANPVVTYATPGKFDVKLTVYDGKHTQSIRKTGYIAVDNCSGIPGTQPAPTGVTVYPNPTAGTISIRLADHIFGPVRIDIFDGLGNQVFSQHRSQAGKVPVQVDLYRLRCGIYMLRVTASDRVFTTRIVKN